MKATLIVLALAALLSVTVTQQASSNTQRSERATSVQSTTCPVYAPPSPVEVVSEEVTTYKHCVKCNTGVYLLNVDNTIKCTFCGAAESGN